MDIGLNLISLAILPILILQVQFFQYQWNQSQKLLPEYLDNNKTIVILNWENPQHPKQ